MRTTTLTPEQYQVARDKIAWACCEVNECGGTRKKPCKNHRAAATKFMQDCERIWDATKDN